MEAARRVRFHGPPAGNVCIICTSCRAACMMHGTATIRAARLIRAHARAWIKKSFF